MKTGRGTHSRIRSEKGHKRACFLAANFEIKVMPEPAQKHRKPDDRRALVKGQKGPKAKGQRDKHGRGEMQGCRHCNAALSVVYIVAADIIRFASPSTRTGTRLEYENGNHCKIFGKRKKRDHGKKKPALSEK